MQEEITNKRRNTGYETDYISPPLTALPQASPYKPQAFMTTGRFSRCVCPSRSGYLERRQAEAIGEVVCLLFGDLLLAQPQPQLLKGDYTDVAGHVVTLRVQGIGLARVKVVNKATFALNTQKRKKPY